MPTNPLDITKQAAPGDAKTDTRLAEYLRVNHAGERAAQTIYKGQLAVLGNHPDAAEIRHMMEQEEEHLEAFDHLLNEYQVRPSVLDPVWGAAGFLLGAATAALGPKAAMACTIAVEEVIGTHYDKQVRDLSARDAEPELVEVLARFRDEELEHRDIAVAHDGREAPAYGLMQKIISTGCKTAIKIAEKI
jgi:ubiquinone biosynthesis monooxygenase Coq7